MAIVLGREASDAHKPILSDEAALWKLPWTRILSFCVHCRGLSTGRLLYTSWSTLHLFPSKSLTTQPSNNASSGKLSCFLPGRMNGRWSLKSCLAGWIPSTTALRSSLRGPGALLPTLKVPAGHPTQPFTHEVSASVPDSSWSWVVFLRPQVRGELRGQELGAHAPSTRALPGVCGSV